MNSHDLYLISPELAVASLGILVILVDLLLPVRMQRWLPAMTVLGLSIPILITVLLWNDLPFDPGLSGTLIVDQFALFFKILILAIVAVIVMSSGDYIYRFKRFQGEYYGLILFSASGMMLLASTAELISIYISLELATLPLVALAAFRGDARSNEAGLKFLLLSAMSSGILLYGLVLVVGFTGTTHLADILVAIGRPVGDTAVPFGSYAMLVGVVLIVAGFGFKISAFPFQMWVPDVYEGAPTPVTAFLSVASKAAGFAILLRTFYLAFGNLEVDWWAVFAALSAISMTLGNLIAIAQNNIKRMLAYSTIAHAGYILIGLAAIGSKSTLTGESSGPGSVLFYLSAYAVTNLAAFGAVIAICNKVKSEAISDFVGIARQSPWIGIVMTVSLISLIGLPPTAGFMGKLMLFNAAIEADLLWLALLGVGNSVLSAYYYVKVMRTMYLEPDSPGGAVSVSLSLKLALLITTTGVVILGILPGPLRQVAKAAAAILG